MAKLHQSRQKPHPRWHKEIRLALELVPLVAVEARPVVKPTLVGTRVLVLESSVLCTSSSSCFNRMLTLLNWSNGIDAACSSCTARSQRPCGTRSMPWPLNDYPKEDADDSVVEQVRTELAHELSGVCHVVWTQPLVVGADCNVMLFELARRAARQMNRERSQVYKFR